MSDGSINVVVGGHPPDDGRDHWVGTDGDDVLYGLGGDDTLEGGAGDDLLEGGTGADQIDGGDGIDTVSYRNSDGGVTVDLSGVETASGGDAAGDRVTRVENVYGSDYNDAVSGTEDKNTIFGEDGQDRIEGKGGDDFLRGGDGLDTIYGGAGDDLIFGDKDIDSLMGGDGDDIIEGGGGDDMLMGGAGVDTLNGGAGADMIDGGGDKDTVRFYWHDENGVEHSSDAVTVDLGAGTGSGGWAEGDSYRDVENVDGSQMSDMLTGDGGANDLRGNKGDDTLMGGGGDDMLTGGLGGDTFMFGSNEGRNNIADFTSGEDMIKFGSTMLSYEAAKAIIDGMAMDAAGNHVYTHDGTTIVTTDAVAMGDLYADQSAPPEPPEPEVDHDVTLDDGDNSWPGAGVDNSGNDTVNALGGDDTIDGRGRQRRD